jgi:hypothetical protein
MTEQTDTPTVLVHFDPAKPPESVATVREALGDLERAVENIKALIVPAMDETLMVSPMDVRRVKDHADRLSADGDWLKEAADELYEAAKAAHGLTVAAA